MNDDERRELLQSRLDKLMWNFERQQVNAQDARRKCVETLVEIENVRREIAVFDEQKKEEQS